MPTLADMAESGRGSLGAANRTDGRTDSGERRIGECTSKGASSGEADRNRTPLCRLPLAVACFGAAAHEAAETEPETRKTGRIKRPLAVITAAAGAATELGKAWQQ
jgi:hypothetical protein